MKLLRPFRYAFEGVFYLIRCERNFRVELTAALCAVLFARAARLEAREWSVLFAVFALVLGLEAFNTALERCVDLVTSEKRPLAKAAKDCAAGAVLIAALMSLGVGYCLFVPEGRGAAIAAAATAHPFASAFFVLAAVLFIFVPGDGGRADPSYQ